MSPNPTKSSLVPSRNATWSLEAALESELSLLGYEIVMTEWAGNGGRRVLRVYLEALDPEKSVSIDDCARMSRVIGNALEALEQAVSEGRGDPQHQSVAAVLREPFVLEVSSPGLERPLAKRRHYERFQGKRIKVRTEEPIEADSRQRTFHGTIQKIEDDANASNPDSQRDGILILDELDSHREVRIALSQIRRANLVYEG